MHNPTIELVQFRLQSGVDEEAFLAAVNDMQAVITRLPGFLSRELLRGDDGLWVDLVHWQSKVDALAAAEAFGTMPELAAFASMIDETHMTMLHFARAHHCLPYSTVQTD